MALRLQGLGVRGTVMNTNSNADGWNGAPWTAPDSSRNEPSLRYLIASVLSFVVVVFGLLLVR